MKKLVVLTIILILIAGCSQTSEVSPEQQKTLEKTNQEPQPKEETTKMPELPPSPPEAAQQPLASQNTSQPLVSSPSQPSAAAEPAISEEAKALFNKKSKISSHNYFYYGPPNDALAVKHGMVGSKIRIDPPNLIKSDGKTYNVIFIDRETRTAELYCEPAKDCTAKARSNAPFENHYLPVPLDFLENVKSAKIINSEFMNNRKIFVVNFTDNQSRAGQMWVDSTFGVPFKVVVGNSKYEYRDYVFNDLSEEDVTLQNI